MAREKAFFKRHTEVFVRPLLERREFREVDGADSPIFIVGMPRCGKTLLEKLIVSDSDARAGKELPFLPRVVARLDAQFNAAYPAWVPRVNADQLRRIAASYLDLARQRLGSASRFTDTLPGNFIYVGLIRMMFPKAPIVHCFRDPLDTCLSCYFTNFRIGQGYSFRLGALADYYLAYRKLMQHWRTVLPNPMIELNYERIVSDPDAVAKKVLGERAAGSVPSSAKARAEIGFHSNEIQRWRDYEGSLGSLKERLAGLPAYDPTAPLASL